MLKPDFDYELKWHGKAVRSEMNREMGLRVRIASQYLRDRTVKNLSKPVIKIPGTKGRKTRVDPDSRSNPGEFPRADTTRLMKDVFYRMVKPMEGVVGTTLDYGLFLEVKMDRSFLRRTLREQSGPIRRILTKPFRKGTR